jgi:hypothetical protein
VGGEGPLGHRRSAFVKMWRLSRQSADETIERRQNLAVSFLASNLRRASPASPTISISSPALAMLASCVASSSRQLSLLVSYSAPHGRDSYRACTWPGVCVLE